MKKIIKISIAGSVGVGKSSVAAFLRNGLSQLGIDSYLIGKHANEGIVENFSENLTQVKPICLIDELQTASVSGDQISDAVQMINDTTPYKIILFQSDITNPEQAMRKANILYNDMMKSSLVVQKTAYEGYYYIHKNRYGLGSNGLVSEDTLLDMILKHLLLYPNNKT
jgi:hypothetical protein